MKQYIVYDSIGKILRTGVCADIDFALQKNDAQFIVEGSANDITQKINVTTKKVVNKTQAQINSEKPREVHFADKRANITNGQLQTLTDRITALEGR